MDTPSIVISGISAIAAVLAAAYSYWQATRAASSNATAEKHARAAQEQAEAAKAAVAAFDKHVEEMKERNRLLKEQVGLQASAQHVEARRVLNDGLQRFVHIRDYLRDVSTQTFTWNRAQIDHAQAAGVTDKGINDMAAFMEHTLKLSSVPDAELELRRFLDGCLWAVRAVGDARGPGHLKTLRNLVESK